MTYVPGPVAVGQPVVELGWARLGRPAMNVPATFGDVLIIFLLRLLHELSTCGSVRAEQGTTCIPLPSLSSLSSEHRKFR